MNKLTASDALYGFAAWLSGREEILTVGASEDSGDILHLVDTFSRVNDLEPPRENRHQYLIYPSDECSGPPDATPESAVKEAVDTLKKAMNEDPSWAHGWHSNIAMACYDAMRDGDSAISHDLRHSIGNDAASRFMKLCFDVETSA